MASGSIVGSRVTINAFAADLLAEGGVHVENGAPKDWKSIRLDDGYGMSFSLSGERSSLRLIVARLLEDLQPDPDPEPDPEQGGAA